MVDETLWISKNKRRDILGSFGMTIIVLLLIIIGIALFIASLNKDYSPTYPVFSIALLIVAIGCCFLALGHFVKELIRDIKKYRRFRIN